MRFLLLCTLLCTTFSAADAQTLPISYEQRFLHPVFRYDNLVVTDQNFRNAMFQDNEALDILRGSGAIEVAALAFSVLGTISIFEGVFADDDDDRIFGSSGTAIGAGVGLTALGLVVQGFANRKRIRAVDIYNTNLGYDGSLGRQLELDFGPTTHGIGLTATF
ncbi:hypothetical protein [Neolewinella antarctica]|uniref:Outer membrane protein beta-barrel domain-containing protein n=1 Tax=Neolewinella antarctica TaxID=442734 RepID=A0ABX0XBI0_9BACT|nr:hypothetical protein [Neolewinella antarctica]NJC26626.1 hypothetical protein [Neolewinella antarctica]